MPLQASQSEAHEAAHACLQVEALVPVTQCSVTRVGVKAGLARFI